MKFIHLTDLHLVDREKQLHDLDPAKRFSLCIDSINQYHSDAECCVVTGDLADRGDEDAYRFLAEQLQRLNMPCHLIIGNHDHRLRFREFFPDTPLDAGGFVQYTVETTAGVFLLLDTVKPGTHAGEYCLQRQDWLRTTLAQHADQPVFLFMHHPPFDLHLPSIDRIGLAEQQAFADVVSAHSNIRHIFFGHAHRPISGNWRGISMSSLRGTNHQIVLDFHVEETIYIDEPPEYSIVFVSADQIVVHTHSYTSQSK